MTCKLPEGRRVRIIYPPHDLPLAIGRELAAHLEQVRGAVVQLCWRQTTTFNYADSQIDGVWVDIPPECAAGDLERIQAILDRYGTWQVREVRAISPTAPAGDCPS